jgi:signal transduction histidine kinase
VGEVVVRGSRSPQGLLVEVIDSGPGVPAAAAQSVFEPGHSAKVGGMGVGLSICRAIVEAHGGQMWVEPGARGHFCFTLPIEVAHAS